MGISKLLSSTSASVPSIRSSEKEVLRELQDSRRRLRSLETATLNAGLDIPMGKKLDFHG